MPPDDAAGPNPVTVTATEAASDPAAATGLTSAEAADRLREDGPNTIGSSGRRTRLAILVAQVASPLVLILC
jgi:P-type Ca2+ transporter type 2C